MLEPQRMDRVLVVGTKDVMETTINKLHELNLLHVEDYVAEEQYFKIGKPLNAATPLSEKLLKLRSVKSYLGTKDVIPVKEKTEKVQKEIEAELGTLEQTVTEKTSKKSALEAELKELDHRSELLKPYEALGIAPELLSGYETVTVFSGAVVEDVEPAVKGITENYELFSAPYGKGRVIALVVPNDVAGKAAEALSKSGFVENEQLREKGEPATIRKSIDEGRAKAEAALKAVGAELAELNNKYARFIASSEELLTIDTQKAEAPLKFATSDNTFVVEGWVPTPDFDRFKAALEKATDDNIYVTKIEPVPEAYKNEVDAATDNHIVHHEVNAPVKYNNPKFVNPIQAFIDLFGRPRYDEIDPTMLFAFVFPLFYGFILGDVGYGLIILILALFLKQMLKYKEGWQILINVMIVCAITSICFGLVFGEFLGFPMAEEIKNVNGVNEGGILGLISFHDLYPKSISLGPIGPFSLPIERLKNVGMVDGIYTFGITDLLLLTFIVGMVHLLLGYAIGFRNELKQHGLRTAILHKGSWMLFMVGGILLVVYILPLAMAKNLGGIDILNPEMLFGTIFFVLGLVMVIVGEGIAGAAEIFTPLSHTLSYSRLLAVGVSSVSIAYAINNIVGGMLHSGIIVAIVAIVIFLVAHTVNLALGIYAPFIQSLRLHYVEFFQKFYKSGGKVYDPFGYNRKYTED